MRPLLFAVCFAVITVTGCAMAPKQVMLLDQNCRGEDIVIRFTEHLSVAPMIDCAIVAESCGVPAALIALMTIQVPVACAIRGTRCNAVVLPIIGADLLREHEYEHMTGKSHPLFFSVTPSCP